MSRILAFFFLICSLGWSAAYAMDPPVAVTMQNATALTATNGTPATVSGYATVGVQVILSATGTVNFEGTLDNSNWVAATCILSSDGALYTTTESSGLYQCNVAGYTQLRARISANTGTITVKSLSTTSATRSSAGGANAFLAGTTKIITWADVFADAFRIEGGTGVGTAIYTHATYGPQINCYAAGVENDCNYARWLNSGKTFSFLDRNRDAMQTITEAVGFGAGITTGLNVDGEGTGNAITLYTKFCGGDLAAINPADSAASHIWNKDAVAGALVPTATASDGTHRGIAWLAFPDADGEYGVQISCRLPPGFTGNIDGVIWWKTTGTGSARFQVQTLCYADDEVDDAAFNTASVVTAAAGTSARWNRQAISAVTITGCAANEIIRFRFFRQRTEASDTLNAALDVESVDFWARNTH